MYLIYCSMFWSFRRIYTCWSFAEGDILILSNCKLCKESPPVKQSFRWKQRNDQTCLFCWSASTFDKSSSKRERPDDMKDTSTFKKFCENCFGQKRKQNMSPFWPTLLPWPSDSAWHEGQLIDVPCRCIPIWMWIKMWIKIHIQYTYKYTNILGKRGN